MFEVVIETLEGVFTFLIVGTAHAPHSHIVSRHERHKTDEDRLHGPSRVPMLWVVVAERCANAL